MKKKTQSRILQIETLESRNLLAVAAGGESLMSEPSGAVTWVVNTISDPASWSTADSVVSLREAIERSSNGDTITFDSALSGRTITLSKKLSITKGITISSTLPDGLSISGNNACQIFDVNISSSYSLNLSGLTLKNGYVTDTNKGAAIRVTEGTLKITGCTFKDSVVTGSIYTGTTRDGGGGIYNKSGNITITNCSFLNNTTNYYGGAIHNDSGTLTLTNTLIAGNKSGSPLGYGGGIFNSSGKVTLTGCTVVGNTSAYGGGIYSYATNGQVNVYNSIILNNTALTSGDDIFTYSSNTKGYYVLSSYCDWTDSDEIFFYNEKQPLFADAENGDYSLAQDSQAIDVGNNVYARSVSTDIVGNPRIVNGTVDLGAYEYNAFPAELLATSFVVSYTAPTSTELTVLPANPSTIQTGETIYVQVWVKNIDGSPYGCTGGYIDIVYDPAIYKAGTYTASSLFPEETTCSTRLSGRVALFGGCCTVGQNDIGVDSWALLGYVSFTVIGKGKSDLSVATPTMGGFEAPALSLTRATVGTLSPSEIKYDSIKIEAGDTFQTPTILTGTNGIFPSYGANRQRIEWTDVHASNYELAYSADGSNWKSSYVSSNYSIVNGLTYGNTMWYKVRALAGETGISSEWSAVKKFYVCPVDIDSDGFVGPGDSSYLSLSWFTADGDDQWHYYCDIDGDGFVGPGDRSYLSANWFCLAEVDPIINPPAKNLADTIFEEDFFSPIWDDENF